MRNWLGIWLLLVASIPLISYGVFDFIKEMQSIEDRVRIQLQAAQELKVRSLGLWLDWRMSDMSFLSKTPSLQFFADAYRQNEKFDPGTETSARARKFLEKIVSESSIYESAFIVDTISWRIVLASSDTDPEMQFDSLEFGVMANKNDGIEFSSLHAESAYSARPVFDFSVFLHAGKYPGTEPVSLMLVLQIDVEESLYPLINENTGLGLSDETLLISADGIVLNELRWVKNAAFRYHISSQQSIFARQQKSGYLRGADYRGVEVASVYTWLPAFQWGLVVKQDYSELTDKLYSSIYKGISLMVVVWLFVGALAFFLMRRLTTPFNELAATTNTIAAGNYSIRLPQFRFSNLNVIANSFNRMVAAVEKDVLSTNLSMQIIGRLGKPQTMAELAQDVCADLLLATEAMISAFYIHQESDGILQPIAAVGIPVASLPVFDAIRPAGTASHAALVGDVHFLRGLDSPKLPFVTIAGIAQPAEIATLLIREEGVLSGAVIIARPTPFTDTDASTLRKILPDLRLALKRMGQRVERDRLFSNIEEKNEMLETLTAELQRASGELLQKSQEMQQQSEEIQQQSEEMQRQNLILEQQQEELIQANKEKSTFLSNMSHELRTPLNVVLSLTKALQLQLDTRTTLEEKEYIGIIENNGRQLLTKINDLLELSRLESGVAQWEVEAIDSRDSVHQIIERLRPLATEKGLGLSLLASDDLPIVHADRRAFELIMQNIISNAIKFTHEGMVKVTITMTSKHLRFIIQDTGIGIPSEHLAIIFKEFHQIDVRARGAYGGVGLGLAIANTAAKKLGGAIDVRSVVGSGSIFTVILPCGAAAERPELRVLGSRDQV